AAGSTIVSWGVGFIRATIISIICLGVLNCPFVPELCNLDNKYSYKSPSESTSVSAPVEVGKSLIPATTRDNNAGEGITNTASLICSEYAVPFPLMLFINRNTFRDSISNISSGPICENLLHLISG